MSGGLFIFGRKTERVFGPTAYVRCPRCGNTSYFVLTYVKTWLEYFFIKIFPYRRQYFLLCDICSWGAELKGERIEVAKRLNAATLASLDGSLSAGEYEAVLGEVRGPLTEALGISEIFGPPTSDT
jgi:hypothetical protein